VNQDFTIRCQNAAGRSFATIKLIPEALVTGRIIDVSPVSSVHGGWKPAGLSLQSILLIRVPRQEPEGDESAEQHVREGEGWQSLWALKLGSYSRPASRLSNSAFSPPPVRLIEGPDSDEYESNPSRSGSSMESSLAGSRPSSAKRPTPPAAAQGPPRPVSAGSRRKMYCFFCGQVRKEDRISDCPGRLSCCYWYVAVWLCGARFGSLVWASGVCFCGGCVCACVYVCVCVLECVTHQVTH
jgi:hypothetical protein